MKMGVGQLLRRVDRSLRHHDLSKGPTHVEEEGDRLETILQGIADGVTAQDATGRLVYANEAAARLIGYPSVESLLATPLIEVMRRFEIMDETGRPLSPGELPGRRTLQGSRVSETILRYRVVATGEERWTLTKASPVVDQSGKVRLVIHIFRDVTEQKRVEESQRFLAEATGLLASSLDYETTLARVARLAVPHIADWCAVDVVGEEGSIRSLAVAHVDPAKVELAREMRRRYPPDLRAPLGVPRVVRTGRSELHPDIPDSLLVDATRDEEHLRIARELGMRSAMIVPMVARDRTLGAITFVSAESRHRYGPADLALAEDLGRRAALAVDNARLYREAREAIRMRDEFFSTISHDLKNPLTGIKGMAQLLRRQVARLEAPGVERLLEGLDHIEATAVRMTGQVNELLDLARLQMGRDLDLARKPTDLVSLARQVAESHQENTVLHHIRLDAKELELMGRWDRSRLERVLVNLLSNAVKYSPGGGEIVVAVSREDGAGGSWAVLSVGDHGLGIPAVDLPRIFDGFHRAGNVVGRMEGTGIGLASARQIVRLHGGTITAASQEGVGSTFTVRLPLQLPNG